MNAARQGYTLLEMILVLVIMVLVASLAFPMIEPMLSDNSVTVARDLVRARWAEMRGRAMVEGRAYRFAVTENTGKFRVAPDDDISWTGTSDSPDPDDKALIIEGELPEGILFTSSESAFAGGSAPAPGTEWGMTVAVYLANGTARDDAVIYFGNANQRVLGLQLRGLTGAVSAAEPSMNGEVLP